MKSETFLLSAVAALLAGAAIAAAEPAKPHPPPPQKATAAQLIDDAKRAAAFIGKTLKESPDKSLDLKNVRQQPFWTVLKKTEESITGIEEQLKSHDLAFFDAVNSSTQFVAELKGALPRSGIKNPMVEAGVHALCNALTLLRKNYGVQALRKRQGGALSEQEQTEFSKLKEAEKKLVAQMEVLQAEVKTNTHLNAELNRLVAQLKKSIDAPFSVDELNTALELVDVVEGEWDAYSFYVDPRNRKAWQDSNVAQSMKAVADINKETKRDVAVTDWTFLEESMEFPDTLDVSVEIEINEVDGYIHYIEESVDGVELELYYEAATDENMQDTVYEEVSE